ncbi:unnamed protein product [Adineta ricciae]|uniref:Uncharacterized protein n=1 Tax=Adineta ricciae TaxID=249248 RepID=A0A813Q4J6_ADIRI|nr:unnamed protein product [Adineta ricciae]
MFLSTMNRVRLSNLLTSQKTLNFLRCANVNTQSQTEGEKKLSDVLKSRFANARLVNVKDTSSGCGASYEIVVVTDEFAKMRTVNQHRLVSDAISKQLPNIHAIRIFTE